MNKLVCLVFLCLCTGMVRATSLEYDLVEAALNDEEKLDMARAAGYQYGDCWNGTRLVFTAVVEKERTVCSYLTRFAMCTNVETVKDLKWHKSCELDPPCLVVGYHGNCLLKPSDVPNYLGKCDRHTAGLPGAPGIALWDWDPRRPCMWLSDCLQADALSWFPHPPSCYNRRILSF